MVWGLNLKDEQTFSYKISKALNINVYNKAIPGGGVAQILYQLRSPILKKLIKEEPKYIFYFYYPDHLRRIRTRVTPTDKTIPNVFYKRRNNGLEEEKFLIFKDSYLYSTIQEFLLSNHHGKEPSYVFLLKDLENLFELYLSEINKEIKKQYPNSKFIIIKLTDHHDFENKALSKYNVINITSLTGIDLMNDDTDEKYWSDWDYHPSELYWNKAIPELLNEIQKFN